MRCALTLCTHTWFWRCKWAVHEQRHHESRGITRAEASPEQRPHKCFWRCKSTALGTLCARSEVSPLLKLDHSSTATELRTATQAKLQTNAGPEVSRGYVSYSHCIMEVGEKKEKGKKRVFLLFFFLVDSLLLEALVLLHSPFSRRIPAPNALQFCFFMWSRGVSYYLNLLLILLAGCCWRRLS